MLPSLADELLNLTPAERIQLAEDLWDSVAINQADVPPLSKTQCIEIERRLRDHERDPSTAQSWESVRQRLWARLERA